MLTVKCQRVSLCLWREIHIFCLIQTYVSCNLCIDSYVFKSSATIKALVCEVTIMSSLEVYLEL